MAKVDEEKQKSTKMVGTGGKRTVNLLRLRLTTLLALL